MNTFVVDTMNTSFVPSIPTRYDDTLSLSNSLPSQSPSSALSLAFFSLTLCSLLETSLDVRWHPSHTSELASSIFIRVLVLVFIRVLVLGLVFIRRRLGTGVVKSLFHLQQTRC